jgi:hypothetical protein
MLAGSFTVLTAMLFAPILNQMSTSLLGPPEDNLQDFWNSWYATIGWHGGPFFFTNLIRFRKAFRWSIILSPTPRLRRYGSSARFSVTA